MIVFVHIEVTAFVAFGFTLIIMEFRILYLLKTNIEKIVEIFNNALLKENLYLIEIEKINLGFIFPIVTFFFQLSLNYCVCIPR